MKDFSCEYYLFASDNGEIFSGAIDLHKDNDFDEFLNFLTEELKKTLKENLKENPNKLFVLTLDCRLNKK